MYKITAKSYIYGLSISRVSAHSTEIDKVNLFAYSVYNGVIYPLGKLTSLHESFNEEHKYTFLKSGS